MVIQISVDATTGQAKRLDEKSMEIMVRYDTILHHRIDHLRKYNDPVLSGEIS